MLLKTCLEIENNFCYDFFMSIVTGIICSALLFFFSSLFKIGAKNKTVANLELLHTYITSISNDLVWGTEDFKEDYYDNIIVKINFALLYVNEIKDIVFELTETDKKKIMIRWGE